MIRAIKKYLFNIVFIVVVSFVSIKATLHGDFSLFTQILDHLSFGSVAILILVGLLPYFVEAIILKKFANLYLPSYSLGDGFVNSMIGSFFSGITPFSSGGQFAQAYIFKKQKISYTNSTGILLMHFIMYQICLVLYTFVIVVFKYHELRHLYNGFLSLALLGFLCNTAVIVCLILGAVSYKFQHFLTDRVLRMASYLKIVKNYEQKKKKLENYLVDFHRELKVIQRHPKEMFSIFCLFILKLTILYSIPAIILCFLGKTMTLSLVIDCFAVCAFVYLITAFIPLPGASGGSEGTFAVLFGVLVGSVLGRFSMLIWRFVTYYFTIILGCIIFIVYTGKKGDWKQ